jgi:hypothetical protein
VGQEGGKKRAMETGQGIQNEALSIEPAWAGVRSYKQRATIPSKRVIPISSERLLNTPHMQNLTFMYHIACKKKIHSLL